MLNYLYREKKVNKDKKNRRKRRKIRKQIIKKQRNISIILRMKYKHCNSLNRNMKNMCKEKEIDYVFKKYKI